MKTLLLAVFVLVGIGCSQSGDSVGGGHEAGAGVPESGVVAGDAGDASDAGSLSGPDGSLPVGDSGTAPASALLPPDRSVDWSFAGVAQPDGTKGIPSATTVCVTLSPSGGDDTSAIGQALSHCSAMGSATSIQVVKLNAGTFNFTGGNTWTYSNVVLRGSGPGQTTVNLNGDMISVGGFNQNALSVTANLSVDGVKGQTSIHLASLPPWIKTGHLYILDQLDDPSYGVDKGQETSSQLIDGRGLGQLVKVTSTTQVSATDGEVTFEQPLSYGFKVAQQAQIVEAAYDPTSGSPVSYFGIENLRIFGNYDATGTTNKPVVRMQVCTNCWIKNIESDTAPCGVHVWPVISYRVEIRDSYFHDSHCYDAGNGYGVALYYFTTASLIENNIVRHLHVALQSNYGSTGNVFGYNYEGDGWADTQNVPEGQGQAAALSLHGDVAYMTLFEGNQTDDKFLSDFTHGSGGYVSTVFRNRIQGWQTQNPKTFEQVPVSIERYNRMTSFLGNVLGFAGEQTVYEFVPPATCPDNSTPGGRSIFKLGYYSNWGCDSSSFDAPSVLSMYRWGNYDYVHGAMQWNAQEIPADVGQAIGTPGQRLPASLYRTSAPAWFTTKFGLVTWPVFGPDPNSPTSKLEGDVPARVCYVNTVAKGAKYDAAACY